MVAVLPYCESKLCILLTYTLLILNISYEKIFCALIIIMDNAHVHVYNNLSTLVPTLYAPGRPRCMYVTSTMHTNTSLDPSIAIVVVLSQHGSSRICQVEQP